jgi:hypothetical protein
MTASYIFYGLLYINDDFKEKLQKLKSITNTKIESKKILIELENDME